jgi:hypothetical protein
MDSFFFGDTLYHATKFKKQLNDRITLSLRYFKERNKTIRTVN